MTASVTLLMAVHAHQPIGNFPFVFEDAYAKAYDPFLQVLERHPGVRLALHYSGCLLDWLLANRPEFLRRLRTLVARGQVELLASGYYEPILPIIPEADRQGQIAMMRAALRRQFGVEAHGLWLTERVWEPELPLTLANAGIRYTMVDTNQFAVAKPWLPRHLQIQDESFWDLLGSYATDYNGSRLRLFPASKRLRYWMPFQMADRTIEFLRRLPRETPVAITFADDAEKFGLWPKTYRWVYEEGWLDQFFSALEREQGWLATATFKDYTESAPPDGTVALPCGSYEEMLEWSGGSFRNFFTKYPEAKAMQQKMLRISETLQSFPMSRPPPRPAESDRRGGRQTLRAGRGVPHAVRRARQALYQAQCNCAYWHGVFGGLYLTHLRRAVYGKLIESEQLVNRAMQERTGRRHRGVRGSRVAVVDVDADGRDEFCLSTAAMGLVVDPADGGTITEWSLYGPRINLLDTLTRRPEPYHEKLRTRQTQPAAPAGQRAASIHDLLGVKEEHLESHLVYDDHRRSAFLDYALQDLPGLHEVMRSAWGERRLWSAGPFHVTQVLDGAHATKHVGVVMARAMSQGRLQKTVRVALSRPGLECRYDVEEVAIPVVALEFNWALRDERSLAPRQASEVTRLEFAEPSVGVTLRATIEPAATIIQFPVETVSESEGGMERTYQGLCVVCLWSLGDAGRRWSSRVTWTIA